MRPYFEEDGIALHYGAPAQWLALSRPLLREREGVLEGAHVRGQK